MTKKFLINTKVTVAVEVPEGATHFGGCLTDKPDFYKKTVVGVAGDHWWYFDPSRDGWYLASHWQPHFSEPLPPEFLVDNCEGAD